MGTAEDSVQEETGGMVLFDVVGQGELGVAHDAADDVVEIMRDTAGECADGLHLVGPPQLLLEFALFGDVVKYRKNEFFPVQRDDVRRREHIDDLAGFGPHLETFPPDAALLDYHAPESLPVAGIGPQIQLRRRAPDHLFARVAQRQNLAFVHVHVAALVDRGNARGDGADVKNLRKPLFGNTQSLFGLLPTGDIASHAEQNRSANLSGPGAG